MTQYLEIHFMPLRLSEDFGFLCMKAAYNFKITGRMIYGNEMGVFINAIGEENKLRQFINWIIEANQSSDSIKIFESAAGENDFSEFDIYKHSPNSVDTKLRNINY
jgi:hypothetical protein